MGEISYSLYLIHPVVLISMVHIFYGEILIPYILLISFLLTLFFSWLCYKCIEKPSINFGKKIIKLNKEYIKGNGLSVKS